LLLYRGDTSLYNILPPVHEFSLLLMPSCPTA
jgi:hypothetical protein